ncbi:MAG TPA: hypothetical protein VK191_10725 [Symbiobacteriaceae bacterium]|nr:hypothetical protein [Symbiobacteriaceae bacterium]
MPAEERVLLSPTGQLRKPAWAPPFPEGNRQAPAVRPPEAALLSVEAPRLDDPWPLPNLRRRRMGPSRLIALVEASPAGAELLVAAVASTGDASGRTTIALALEPRGRILHARPPGPTVLAAPPEPILTASLLAERLHELQRRADVVVVDLGCRWVPALFRPVLSRADEIWLVGQVGQWGALEARQSQAEFSGWTNLDRISLFALGPPGTGVQTKLGEPITLLEATEPSLTSFAETYWRRQPE